MEGVSPNTERRYDTTETINIGSLRDDFRVKDIQEINENELQSFLTGEPAPEVEEDDIDDITRVNPKKKVEEPEDEEDDSIPSVRKEKKKAKEPSEEDVDDFLTEEEKVASKKKSKKAEEDNEESVFTTITRDLVKHGIFSEEEEDINDAEGFKNRFVKEMHKGANSILDQFLSQHGPEYREAFESIFVNGVNPETYFRHVERIDNLQELDLKSVDNQERILRNFYKSKGFSVEKVDKKIEGLKNLGDLEDEAAAVHEILLKEETESLEEERERAQIEAQRREQNKQNYRSSIQRILSDKIKAKSFDGIPVDPATANKVYSSLTQDAYRLPDGRLITEFDKAIIELDKPENFEKKLKLALLLNNNLDLSKIKSAVIKNENNEIFEGLQRKRAKKEIPGSDSFKSFF
jgi:hypothetical protein